MRREARKQEGGAVGGRGDSQPTKGNPIPPGPTAHMGEPLSASEAKEQLLYAHIGLAKVIRSEVDFDDLDDEFTVAGKNYAHVANHIYPPLRVVIRFVAPLVLVAVLLVIWGHMIAATPWIHQIRNWWQSRRDSDEMPPPPPAHAATAASSPPAGPQPAAGATAPSESPQQAPPVPRRIHLVRTLGHRL